MIDAQSLEARRAAESAARNSYGRLIAMLVARTRDIGAAEDALAEAFAAALRVWPVRGVPDKPDAWLITAARRNLLHRLRRRRVEQNAVMELLLRMDERLDLPKQHLDRRLELLFVCAHPALDESVRTPLMLQTVLGLDAERIASAFLVSPSALAQRLVRAKAKIKQSLLRFELPDESCLPERLEDVLRAVYVAYGAGWDDFDRGRGLTEEAIFLGRTLVGLLPDEPEAKGLLALMLHCEARREARRDPHGRFVPLPQQNPALWSRPSIVEAEALLTAAASVGRFGRFQCEAAIQSVHAQRAITGTVNWAALRVLYDLLLDRVPSIGVAVGRAAMLLESGDLDAAASALNALLDAEVVGYQPYWVTRARLAELRGDAQRMREALERALGLTQDAAVRQFLRERLERCPL